MRLLRLYCSLASASKTDTFQRCNPRRFRVDENGIFLFAKLEEVYSMGRNREVVAQGKD